MRSTSLVLLSFSLGSLAAGSVIKGRPGTHGRCRPRANPAPDSKIPDGKPEPDLELLADCVAGESFKYGKHNLCKVGREGLHLLDRQGNAFRECLEGVSYKDAGGSRFVTVDTETLLCYDKASGNVFDQIGKPVGTTDEPEKYKTLRQKEGCVKGIIDRESRFSEAESEAGPDRDMICRTEDGKLWQADGSQYMKCDKGEVFRDNQGKLGVSPGGITLICFDKTTRKVMDHFGNVYGTAPGADEEGSRKMMEGCVKGDFIWKPFLENSDRAFCLTREDGRVWSADGIEQDECQKGAPIVDKQGQRVSGRDKKMLCWDRDAREAYDVLGDSVWVERWRLEEWGLKESCVKGSPVIYTDGKTKIITELDLCQNGEGNDVWHFNGTLFEGCHKGEPYLNEQGERVSGVRGKMCRDSNGQFYNQIGLLVPEDEVSEKEAPQKEISQDKVSEKEVPQDEIPQDEIPQDKISQKEFSQDEVCSKGWPQKGNVKPLLCLDLDSKGKSIVRQPDGNLWEGCRNGEPYLNEQGVRVSGVAGKLCRDSNGQFYTQLGTAVDKDGYLQDEVFLDA